MTEQAISLSVVIPVYNEEKNIEKLFEEVKAVCENGMDGIPFDYEIIIVNDGSTDKTDQVCRKLSPATYIRFRKNYGQTSALDCGFKAATKELIAALDGDGQNDFTEFIVPWDDPAGTRPGLRVSLAENIEVIDGDWSFEIPMQEIWVGESGPAGA